MVILSEQRGCGTGHVPRRMTQGWLMVDFVLAIAVLALAMIPLGFAIYQERDLSRTYYFESVATEIVDGELELLATGGWKQFGPGEHDYEVVADSVSQLPEGKFLLTIEPPYLSLEWIPGKGGKGGRVHRTVRIPEGGAR